MEAAIRRMRLQHLKARLELCRLNREALAKEFEKAPTFEERSRIAYEWDHALKDCYGIQLALDLLARHEREGQEAVDFLPPQS